MKLIRYKVQWSPYSTAIKAKSRKEAAILIRKLYPQGKGDFFVFLG